MWIYILILTFAAVVYLATIVILDKLTKRKQNVMRRIATITKEEKKVPLLHLTGQSKQKKKFSFFNMKFMDKLANELIMADIPLRAEEYVVMWFILTIGIPAVFVSLGINVVVTLGFCLIGAALPILMIKFKKNKRMNLFNKQLVEALTIMCNCLKTGFTFQTAMESVAKEMSDPIATEFERMLRETKLGLTLENSLEQMVKRTENKDLELISNAVLIQRQVGGNLAEILESISQTIHERIKIADEIKVLTATGRISGYIIGLLPVFILLILMLINPSYIEELFTTSEGRIALGICVVLELIGFTIVKKIVTVKF